MSQFKKIPGSVYCPYHPGVPMARTGTKVWECPLPLSEHPPMDEHSTQKIGVFPDAWTGALMSIEREQERKRITAHLADPTPTEILLPPPPELTHRFPVTRKKAGLWRRLQHWLRIGR